MKTMKQGAWHHLFLPQVYLVVSDKVGTLLICRIFGNHVDVKQVTVYAHPRGKMRSCVCQGKAKGAFYFFKIENPLCFSPRRINRIDYCENKSAAPTTSGFRSSIQTVSIRPCHDARDITVPAISQLSRRRDESADQSAPKAHCLRDPNPY